MPFFLNRTFVLCKAPRCRKGDLSVFHFCAMAFVLPELNGQALPGLQFR
jgi:hypothetical protein